MIYATNLRRARLSVFESSRVRGGNSSGGVSGIHLAGVFLGVAETIVCSFICSQALLDTGLPRGNVHERDSGPMRGAIPTHSHNSKRLGSFTSHKNKSVKEL